MKILKHIVTLMIVGFLGAGHAFADGTFYLLRHAEKQKDGTNNPHLTQQGRQRANNLAQQLSRANITKIYSTDYHRTIETVEPLSQLVGVAVEFYNPSNLKEFAERLKGETGQIVIVGHSNTTPALVAMLGELSVEAMDEDEYENMYQVVLLDDKAVINQFRIFPIKDQINVQ